MKKASIVIRVCIVLMMSLTFSVAYAQKEEIKAFENINKEMLKQIKKAYKIEPKVEMSESGDFFIIVEGKVNKQKKYIIINQDGMVLNQDPVDRYSIGYQKDYVAMGDDYGKNTLWGVYHKNGKLVLDRKYEYIKLNPQHDGGEVGENNVWCPPTQATWVTYDESFNRTAFYSIDGQELHVYPGIYSVLDEMYYKIGLSAGNYGLYSADGTEIFPMQHDDYAILKAGFVGCADKQVCGKNTLEYWGGKTINPMIKSYTIPCAFFALSWRDGQLLYKLHRDDEYTPIDVTEYYAANYIDDGQKFYDFGDYDNVITFYEGEGMDLPHGNYYMGLASKAKGDTELSRLKKIVGTLNHPTDYYKPIENPGNYTINSMVLGSAYIEAISYLERYLKDPTVDPNDPRVAKAKKARGETVSAKNEVNTKLDEYTRSTAIAADKWAKAKHQAAVRKAQEDAAAEAISNAIGNLISGGK